MSQLDLNKLNIEQLLELEKNAKSMLQQKQREQVKDAYLQFQEIARSLGVTVEDILKAGKGVKSKRPIKYQNPNNPKEGWSGQGRTPYWLVAELEKGKKLEDFLVG